MVKAKVASHEHSLLKKLTKWRIAVVILAVLLVSKILLQSDKSVFQTDHVAQIWLKGFISNDREVNKKISNILSHPRAKALIINIDSPGGTFVGGEVLFSLLKKHSQNKPIVAVLGNQATSAAYMVALGSDHIIANPGTLTGSVGVLLQSAEILDLTKKLGIKPIVLKSSNYKAVPHPAEKLTDESRLYLQDLVDHSQEIFLEMVASNRRNISAEQIFDIKSGKVYVGMQARQMNLVDQIGGIDEALEWLQTQGVDTRNIMDFDLYKKKSNLKNLLNGLDMFNLFGYSLLSINKY